MKKDKAVRNAERKSAIINKVKSLIGPVILLLIILAGVLVTVFYREEEEPAEPDYAAFKGVKFSE